MIQPDMVAMRKASPAAMVSAPSDRPPCAHSQTASATVPEMSRPFMITTVLDMEVISRVEARNLFRWSSTASRA